MRQKSMPERRKGPAARVVKDIRRATRRHFSAEDKIRIVPEGLRGEDSIAELCRARGDRPEPLLPVVERVSRSGQEAAGRRYRPGGNVRH
jgi:transposase-like protein